MGAIAGEQPFATRNEPRHPYTMYAARSCMLAMGGEKDQEEQLPLFGTQFPLLHVLLQ